MQWISTVSQKIDERLYMVFLWAKKYHADSIHRVVYTVDLQKARHPAEEDQVRAELLCGNYFMLRKENQIARLWNGHELSWQAFTPELQTLLLGKNVPESLRPLADYMQMRWQGITMVPMTGTLRTSAMEDGITWVKVDMHYYWRNEVVESVLGPVQVTQKALVRFGNLAKHDANASALRMLSRRLTSEFLTEFEMDAGELRRKQEMFRTPDVKMFFHTHYPSQKLLLVRIHGQEWMMVDAFLFHHTKPKHGDKTAKRKPKTNVAVN